MVIDEEPAHQQDHTGSDVAFNPYPKGLHANMRDYFWETKRKVRNWLRHAKSGSVRLLDDGTVAWLDDRLPGERLRVRGAGHRIRHLRRSHRRAGAGYALGRVAQRQAQTCHVELQQRESEATAVQAAMELVLVIGSARGDEPPSGIRALCQGRRASPSIL